MAARNPSLDEEKDAFLARFRRESGHLVYSREPGGEGRVVSEDEAVHVLTEFTLLAERHARGLSRSVWLSVALLLLFGSIGVACRSAPFTALALLSVFGWLFVGAAQLVIRARFKAGLWDSLGNRAPVRALTRHEKIARGYALPAWQWIAILAIIALSVPLHLPARSLPPEWRGPQALAIAWLCLVAFVALLGYGALRLFRWIRRHR